jgi:hypothetical protein
MHTIFPALLSDAIVAIPLLMSTIVNSFPALAAGGLYDTTDYAMLSGLVSNCEFSRDDQSRRQENATSATIARLGNTFGCAVILI